MENKEDSEKYYNKLMWNLIYIGFGLSLWILFTIHSDYPNQKLTPYLKIALCLFGVLVFSYFSIIIEKTNWRKNKHLKELEPNLPCWFKIKGINFLRTIKMIIISSYLSTAIIFSFIYHQDLIIFLTSIITSLISDISLGFEVSLFFWRDK